MFTLSLLENYENILHFNSLVTVRRDKVSLESFCVQIFLNDDADVIIQLNAAILEKLADLVSKPNGVEVVVKFINRTSRPAYLEMVSSTGDRELKHTLPAGQSWTAVTQEKTYWITTMNQDTDEGLLLNYGWYYSPIKTRMKKERCYITDCMHLFFSSFKLLNK